MTVSTVAPFDLAWKNLSFQLTDWTEKHLLNRSDTYGIYTPDPWRCLLPSGARDLEALLTEKLEAEPIQTAEEFAEEIERQKARIAPKVVKGEPTAAKKPKGKAKEPGDKDKPDGFYYQRLAEQFLRESGKKVVYHQGNHYVYRGDRYEPLKDTEFTYEVREFLLRARVPHNNTVVGNVVPFVNAYCRETAGKQLPFCKGSGDFADPLNVIAYRNGLLDTAKYLAGDCSLIPHTPDWVSTVCLPFAFDPAATCPTWQGFLAQVFEGDGERAALLQEYCGYCLTQDTSMHKLLVMCGVRRSGKGTRLPACMTCADLPLLGSKRA